jgi:hypothetical protein
LPPPVSIYFCQIGIAYYIIALMVRVYRGEFNMFTLFHCSKEFTIIKDGCKDTLNEVHMKQLRTALFAVIIILAAAVSSYAVDDGWAPGSAYNSQFDPDTVETLGGVMVSMDVFRPRGMDPGVRIVLETDEETVPVHLGPVWYMNRLKREIAPGDRIEVTGSRIDYGGKPAIMAAQIRKGAKSLKLRDEEGVPVWESGKK